jgi:hypothetical protein
MAAQIVLVLVAVGTAQQADHASSGALNRALGVECAFCHVPGGSIGQPQPLATARGMFAMVEALNAQLAPVGGHITCWTCHAGSRIPSRIEQSAWQKVLTAWPKTAAPASEDVRLTMAVYTASVGRTCAGCHEGDSTGPVTQEAAEKVRIMNSLFPTMKEFLPSTARTQCFMCHKGRPHPQIRPLD